MKQMYSNATVMWSEQEIAERDALMNQCYHVMRTTWTDINPAITFSRVETPILTPGEALPGHVACGFPMLDTKRGLLRPETTAGCVAAIHVMYPNANQLVKRLPICIWQMGKSFRDEDKPNTMRASKLRLVEFHQLEFELFASANTKADYLSTAAKALQRRFGGILCCPPDIPHYSRRTIDWEMDGLEVAGCSERTDWHHGIIYEVSIGIDRLLAKTLEDKL
jgi:glycyl-tRNA synthetase